MSIAYNVAEGGNKIMCFPKGALNLEDITGYFERLVNDDNIKPGALEIVHFDNGQDFQFGHDECKTITGSYRQVKERRNIKATIFVCGSTFAFGMARMLQTFFEMNVPGHKVFLVKGKDELPKVIDQLND
ncbi:MAG TPA: hypothetical protein DIT32_00350 [Peptococcaceae bacterium]|nr:hypothetical protein [Peptococcaceae bacterium]